MQESNNLTKKEFWSKNWRGIKLPARYFYDNYARKTISSLIKKYVCKDYSSFLEIGGCPGRWSDYFFSKFKMVCDSMDYDENNIKIIKENYRILKIKGESFLGDITKTPKKERIESYDIVLSDGLIEHFIDSEQVFNNHVNFLKKKGILIVGVPNIKKSWFYNHLALWIDKKSHIGYRHISKEELIKHSKKNNLQVLFCDYIGVFNLGVVHSKKMNFFLAKSFVLISLISDFLLKLLNVKKETKTFSPAIYLIAKKR